MAVEVPGVDNLEFVGRGGFATVFRGTQVAYSREVAVKVLTVSELDDMTANRFERECRANGSLSHHPNIVSLYASGIAPDGHPYLVMDYLSRGSLADRVHEHGPITVQAAVDIGIALSGALETAHRAGIIHRDVKPENVLFSVFDAPALGDFGISSMAGAFETRSGSITTSVLFAAPEVFTGTRASPATDIYSLAATLVAAIRGVPAFYVPNEDNLYPLLHRVTTEPVPDLRPNGVPDPVATVFEQAMAKSPAERPPSAEAFGRALADAARASGMSAVAISVAAADPAAGAAAVTGPDETDTTVIAAAPLAAADVPAEVADASLPPPVLPEPVGVGHAPGDGLDAAVGIGLGTAALTGSTDALETWSPTAPPTPDGPSAPTAPGLAPGLVIEAGPDRDDPSPSPSPSSRRGALLVLAGVLVVLFVIVAGAIVVRGRSGGETILGVSDPTGTSPPTQGNGSVPTSVATDPGTTTVGDPGTTPPVTDPLTGVTLFPSVATTDPGAGPSGAGNTGGPASAGGGGVTTTSTSGGGTKSTPVTTPPTTTGPKVVAPPPPSPATVPTAPRSVQVAGSRIESRVSNSPDKVRVTFSWTGPATDGGAAVTKYRVRRTIMSPSGAGRADELDVDNLVGTTGSLMSDHIDGTYWYRYEIAAVNSVGPSPWATADIVAPNLTGTAQADAPHILRAAGFFVVFDGTLSVQGQTGFANESVWYQSPKAGTYPVGQRVDLWFYSTVGCGSNCNQPPPGSPPHS